MFSKLNRWKNSVPDSSTGNAILFHFGTGYFWGYCKKGIVIYFVCWLILPALAAQVTLDPKYIFEHEPERVALVIGNRTYTNLSRIESSATDAEMMRDRLLSLGFDVEYRSDVQTISQFQTEVLPAFRRKINPGAFVVFYFSGHGFSHGQHNMLAPTAIPLEIPESDITSYAISVDALQDLVAGHLPGVIVFFIDACRSIGGFVIRNPDGHNIIGKGPALSGRTAENVNFFITYATRPGHVAAGSSEPGSLSVFTSVLVDHIETKGQPFSSVFREIAARVQTLTNSSQDPGAYDWSKTDPYFLPDDDIIGQQRRAWHAALAKGEYDLIDVFSRRYSVSRHAAASRKWLSDNLESRATRFTLASPVSIDRAWSSNNEERASVLRLGGPFAFLRSINSVQAETVRSKPDSQVGVLDSSRPTTKSELLAMNLTSIKTHEKLVLTRDVFATFLTDKETLTTKLIKKGTLLEVADIVIADKAVSIAATQPNRTRLYKLSLNLWGSLAPLDLGFSLREIVAPPRDKSIPDLVDENLIEKTIKDLRQEGYKILWVSLATAKNGDPKETETRAARMADAEYIIKKTGISSVRITSVSGREDFSGDGVRIRFFGTK